MSTLHQSVGRRFILFLAICAAGSWVGVQWGQSAALRQQVNESQPSLIVEQDALDFGEAWVQPAFVYTFPVKNLTSRPVRVVAIEPSCACTSVEPDSFMVAPTAAVPLSVELNLLSTAPVPGHGASRFVTTLTALLDDGSRISWQLTGKVKRLASTAPSAVLLGDLSIYGGPYESRLIQVRFYHPVGEVSVRCPPRFGKVAIEKTQSDVNVYRVRFEPAVPPLGQFKFTIEIDATSPTGQPLPSIAIPVQGRVVPDVQASPDVVNLGVCTPGDPLNVAVELWSVTGAPFTIIDAVVVSGTSEFAIARPSENEFILSAEACGAGMQTADFTVTLQDAVGVQCVLSVPIHYAVIGTGLR